MNPTATTIREYDQNALDRDETETATFALGCFWGPEAQFGAMDGIVRTRVGYAGGTKLNPTYRELGDQTEAFRVDYDTDDVSYADLLAIVFDSHDPNHQPRKRQYQNIVFTDSPEQREALETYLEANGLDVDSIETRIESLTRFYPAESYHQKYNLKAKQSLLNPFEEAGYDDEELQESPAAAKLNGYAGGHDIPEEHEIGAVLDRSPSS
ncbi:peptide-methionine (S)-S-oxide reductase MsrA [Halopelagius longus]|uniref:peptide-methionine (S)-S-oxide reductase n=1 Tax=Halopelagius longus TaxID=1236180 RepID=A0A1H1GRS3_9EURY|nr:peptide-methionine (S)-S-oxide reductase [Halopelagius longus]RDI69518.1 peptide-methionine (S)-S-oxide reductase [Halopelagius longus]SDR15912.1 peptide-methionine (S)-S-oxide reductase [Halopelagius longus]